MKVIAYLSTVAIILSLATCTNPISIGSDFNTSIDFSSYSTYRWHEGNEFNLRSRQYLANDIIDERIRSNVDRELRSKGYYLQENGPVDFLVNYSVSTEDRIDIETYNRYAGYAPGWTYSYASTGPYRYGGAGFRYDSVVSDTTVSQYAQGTLVLDIVQPETNILVWRGIAEAKIELSLDQAEREELVREATTRMLQNFPPPAN